MSDLFDRRPAVDASVAASGESAIAAGGNIAQAITGSGSVGLHIETATLLTDACPSAASVDCPPGLNNLPSRAALFVGRDRELALLDEALATPGQAVVHAMHGLGGIGKSTLAARWAARHGAEHAPVWWIPADSRAAVDAGLAALAAALQPSLVTLLPQEQLGEWAQQWLTSHTGWLLVLDNVSDPTDIEPLLSRATSGRFLITSRRATGWQGIAEQVELDVLSVSDAADLFTQIRGGDRDSAAELCEELGCLPLAVEQAAAYCAETNCTARAYLDDLAAYPADMYAATDEGGDNERTIARIWHLTLDRLADDPLAGRILLILAWYAPDDIPRALLDSLSGRPAVRRALGRLKAHSMITLYDDTVSVHRLVQAVSRTPVTGDRHRHGDAVDDARETAVRALVAALPEDVEEPSAWPAMRALLPHIEALAEHAPPDDEPAAMARLLSDTGNYLLCAGIGNASRGLRLLRRAEAACVRLYGPEAVETLEVRTHCAHAERMRLIPEGPETVSMSLSVSEQVLADCVRVLGDDHRVTVSARENMARVAAVHLGDVNRAVELADEVVAVRVRALGEDHPLTFRARNLRTMFMMQAGDLVGACDAFEELHAAATRTLGPEHSETLAIGAMLAMLSPIKPLMKEPISEALFRLAGSYVDTESLAEALRTLKSAPPPALAFPGLSVPSEEELTAARRNVEACVRVLGEDHPDTYAARAGLLQAQALHDGENDPEELRQLLMGMFSGLDQDHPAMIMMQRMTDAWKAVSDD